MIQHIRKKQTKHMDMMEKEVFRLRKENESLSFKGKQLSLKNSKLSMDVSKLTSENKRLSTSLHDSEKRNQECTQRYDQLHEEKQKLDLENKKLRPQILTLNSTNETHEFCAEDNSRVLMVLLFVVVVGLFYLLQKTTAGLLVAIIGLLLYKSLATLLHWLERLCLHL
jgi:chromosome segregation ATPase